VISRVVSTVRDTASSAAQAVTSMMPGSTSQPEPAPAAPTPSYESGTGGGGYTPSGGMNE
jgi:hypothetical protein